jgi:hypothetical protein
VNDAFGFFVANAAGAQWPMSGVERTAALHADVWHAYADTTDLGSGSSILITGGHRRVRIRSGDRLTIEMPHGRRYELLVLLRADHSMRTADQNGTVQDLSLVENNEQFQELSLSDGFSREIWRLH